MISFIIIFMLYCYYRIMIKIIRKEIEMSISVYLNFDGNASEAINFYKGIFGGEVFKMTYGEMPEEEDFVLPDDKKKLVAFASIDINGGSIKLSDVIEGFGPGLSIGNNVNVMYSTSDYDEAKRVYDALLDKGKEIMPFAKTFWSKGYGLLSDRFGIMWHIDVDEGEGCPLTN